MTSVFEQLEQLQIAIFQELSDARQNQIPDDAPCMKSLWQKYLGFNDDYDQLLVRAQKILDKYSF